MRQPLIAQSDSVEFLQDRLKIVTPSGVEVLLRYEDQDKGFRVVLQNSWRKLSGRLYGNSILSNYYEVIEGSPNPSDWFVEHNRPTLR